VSTGSFIGGRLMNELKGSATFRLYSYGAFFFFALHVFIQWLIEKIAGPYGKKSGAVQPEGSDLKLKQALDANKEVGEKKLDDGFSEIDLTR